MCTGIHVVACYASGQSTISTTVIPSQRWILLETSWLCPTHCLFPLRSVRKRKIASSLHQIWHLLSRLLNECTESSGIHLYCNNNSSSVIMGRSNNLHKDCLNGCIRCSTALSAVEWYSAPVRCTILTSFPVSSIDFLRHEGSSIVCNYCVRISTVAKILLLQIHYGSVPCRKCWLYAGYLEWVSMRIN